MFYLKVVKFNLTHQPKCRYLIKSICPLVFYLFLFNINETMRTISLIQLCDGTYVKTYQMDKEEFDSLSKDAEKYMKEWDLDIYELKNKNVIIYSSKGGFGGIYCWYPSFTDLKKLRDDLPNCRKSQHFFEGYNPYQSHFPENTRALIDTLLLDLKLGNSLLINEHLISEVDSAILRQDDPQIFMINHILHISALIGEVFLSRTKGTEWYIENDKNGDTWMPMISIEQGNNQSGTISFIKWLYEDIVHYAGVYGVVESSYLSLKDFNDLNMATPRKK